MIILAWLAASPMDVMPARSIAKPPLWDTERMRFRTGMPAGLILPVDVSVTLDVPPTDPGDAALADGEECATLAGERRASCSEDLARL